MEKKYQVFVSSTYKDLQRERQEVMQALLELDCIPVGMELFPAADDDQWTLIKGLISDCDYYVLIVAGRYGSIDKKTERSYTQMEYEFAIEQGIPVISFVHKDPGNISSINTEPTDEGKAKLKNFIELVENKMCQFWNSPEDLGSKVSRSLVKLIKAKPRIGWIKANEISSTEANREIIDLRKENLELKNRIRDIEKTAPLGSEMLSQGNDKILVHFDYTTIKWDELKFEYDFTWNEIIVLLAPIMIIESSEDNLAMRLNVFAKEQINKPVRHAHITVEDFDSIKIQLYALGIIDKSDNKKRAIQDWFTYWKLTPYGEKLMVQLIAVKRN